MSVCYAEISKYLHAPLQFNPSNPLADILNKQEFTTSDLDPESYVVAAGKKTDSINQSFRDELHHKFGNSVSPPLLDSSDPPATSEDIAIYAFLLKNLLFADPFDTNAPMSFGWTKVASFGFGHEVSPGSGAPPNLTSEVRLLRYSSQDDFIIQIRTKSDGEQLVLAKITPAKTLEETIAIVLPTIKPTAIWGLDEKDKLAIPKIDFDLTAHFKELEGKSFDGGRINTAAENIVFRLNEKGAELKAFATISMTLGGTYPPPKPLDLIFDKPFLVLLKRESSPRPYFAMWVGNPTLLVSP
jgi:hypothetical protein